MDERVEKGLNRFVNGQFELFGNPRDAVKDEVLAKKLENEISYRFSTFCVYLAVNSFNLAIDSYADAVTEGYCERGFDGIVISVDDRPLHSPEDAQNETRIALSDYKELLEEESELSPSPPVVKILMMQVKMNDKTDMADLDHLGNSAVRFLSNPDYVQDLKPNDMVKRWWYIFDAIRKVYTEFDQTFAPELDLLFIYQSGNLEESQLNLEAGKTSTVNCRNQLGHDKVNYTIWRSEEIIDAIALAEQAVDGTLKRATLIPLPSSSAAKGWMGHVPAFSIAKLIPQVQFVGDQNTRPDERAFYDNVRSFTGKNKNNLGAVGLQKTITKQETDQVILRHNGITIVTREANLLENDAGGFDVELKSFQIVNGAQSSYVIQELVDLLGDAHVPVKIIVTENETIKTGVVLGANTQQQVNDYDLLARSAEVRAIQLGFDATDWRLPEKLWLRRRRGERFPTKVNHAFQIVTPRQLLEAYVAVIDGVPHSVHASAGKLVLKVPNFVFRRDHHPSLYRALGWLVATGRHWAKKEGFIWTDDSGIAGEAVTVVNPANNNRTGRKKIYAARHHFVYALWHLTDPNPEAIQTEQGKLSHKSEAVRDRFEAVCKTLADRDQALALADRAAAAVEMARTGKDLPSFEVRKKPFTDRVKEALKEV